MHPAWYIDDIRDMLFEHLGGPDLARLARTSQAFFHIATDRLWATIDSLQALLCCLPPDFGDRPLLIEDIQRLDFYTAKVRNLKLEIDRDNLRYQDRGNAVIRLPPEFINSNKCTTQRRSKKSWKSLWDEIAELRPPSKLLCNLRYLHVNDVVEEVLIPLIGISGLHLTKIYIKHFQARQTDDVVYRILDGFQDVPNLEYLFVRDGQSGILPRKLIRQAPLKHLRLDHRKYSEPFVSNHRDETPILYDILQKSTIEHLTITLTHDWYTPKVQTLKGKHLPALRTLWLSLMHFAPQGCKLCGYSSPPGWVCGCVEADPRPSPITFFERLANPELDLLHIKFPGKTSGRMLLELITVANRSCRLQNLTELALTGGQYASESLQDPGHGIVPTELRMAIMMLLPLLSLKFLRIGVARRFLEPLDLKLYQSITDGLQALQKLWLGHVRIHVGNFERHSKFSGRPWYEHVPLDHLAAFCQMLPNLVEVSVGAAMVPTIPRPEFTCPSVKSVRILHGLERQYTGVWKKATPEDVLMYFPNSGYGR